jgi:exodeoxyribonuclease VII large subunit
VSVVLLVRGGGSLEDLQAFNSETVARAIADCPIPVITGVGHEVDVSIADLVADLRAPTPSAAAERALPERRTLAGELRRGFAALVSAARERRADAAARLDRAGRAVAQQSPEARVRFQRQRLQAAARAVTRATRARAQRGRQGLGEAAARLQALSPLAVLGRGYGLVRRAADQSIVRGPDDIEAGERLAIRVDQAELEALVEAVHALRRG